jgi:hypothetical protein|tara:strand:+ start:841 stop:993 length:153 start_codon:yes stop_codon:yes gene_type:complete
MSRLSDKLLEVELFIGENIFDMTETEILDEVEKEFKFNIFVDHAKELLEA